MSPFSTRSGAPAAAALATASHCDALSAPSAFEPLPEEITCSLLLDADPHDETLEIEITEDMVNLALEAVDDEQVWPYAADRRLVARPYRQARILRFPGC